MVAERLTGARGPVRVVCPTGGFSLADVPGGDLWDPEADAAFIDFPARCASARDPSEEVDAHVDDPEFADLVAERYPHPGQGDRTCRMTAAPSRTACSTSRLRTSRGSRSARTSSSIPIGSLEQHGAHLPLGTDTITALEVSRRAAEKADVPYTPPFWAGYSPQHMREPETGVGTITSAPRTLNEAWYDIAAR